MSSTISAPKIPKHCRLFVERFGKVRHHDTTPSRPFVVHCLMDGESPEEAITLHSNTFQISAAVEFVRLAVKATQPTEIIFYDSELEAAYKKKEAA